MSLRKLASVAQSKWHRAEFKHCSPGNECRLVGVFFGKHLLVEAAPHIDGTIPETAVQSIQTLI